MVLSLRPSKVVNRGKYSILRIGLLGSAARDELTEKNDIDIVVELTDPDLFKLIGIKQDLEVQFAPHNELLHFSIKFIMLFLSQKGINSSTT